MSELTSGTRPFRREDWLSAMVGCPHCHRVLKIVEARGPYLGFNPTSRQLDRWWEVILEDGEGARMWEDGKGVVIT